MNLPDINLGIVNNESMIVLVIVMISVFGFMYYVLNKIDVLVKTQLEYNKNKNDHMERMALKFSEITECMVKEVTIMSTELKNITERQNYNVNLLRSELDKSTRALQDYNHIKNGK